MKHVECVSHPAIVGLGVFNGGVDENETERCFVAMVLLKSNNLKKFE
jgi:hypothetical protein